MAPFSYKAKDSSGATTEGTLDAEGRAQALQQLQSMGLFPISVQSAGGGDGAAPDAGSATTTMVPKLGAGSLSKTGTIKLGSVGGKLPTKTAGGTTGRLDRAAVLQQAKLKSTTATVSRAAVKPAAAKAPAKAERRGETPKPVTAAKGATPKGRRRKITAGDMASFNRQLADLLGSGVALVKALTILQRQTPNALLQEAIAAINSDVQGGDTFADALAKHPKLFSPLYVAMVRSGEAGGMLDDVLQRLADFSEQEEQLKGRVKSALAYPVVMIAAGSVAVFVMFSYVVPKIVQTFEAMNQTLPLPTRILIRVSRFTESYWYVVIAAVALLALAIWQALKQPHTRRLFDRHVLRVPILGEVFQKREVARFARTLGSLLKNGVSILAALQITKDVLNNSIARDEVTRVQEEITQGAGMAEPLRHSLIFPPVAVNMMAVGEETGRLEYVLLRISDSYELEVDRKVRTLTSLIEPLIIVVMGLIVAFIVISMLLPIFSLDPTGGAG